MGVNVSVHVNTLPHQLEHGVWMTEGFRKLGYDARITHAPTDDAEIHVVSGPHYALRANIGKRVLMIDRAYWGDPQCISLAWLDADGGKQFVTGAPDDRPKPALQPMRVGDSTLGLADYGMSVSAFRGYGSPIAEFRMHPVSQRDPEPLQAALSRHQVAVGFKTTALVEAAIQGLKVNCLDTDSPCFPLMQGLSRVQWLNNLSYMNWSGEEIASGEALQHYVTD